MQTLNIQHPNAAYPIHIGHTIITQGCLAPYIAGTQVLVVTNETLASLYLPQCLHALSTFSPDTFIVPDGEAHKTIATWQSIITACIEKGHRRNTTLVALGGGVIGDMTGFAASCYQRGVDFIQIPTTLLAAVDASIGGKTAVNHPLGKNMIGAFHQPRAVIIDCATFATLPDDEYACGMAEVIKAAMIASPALFRFCQQQVQAINAREQTVITDMIKQACQIKADIVERDEKERGVRALLNLGHTFAHAIETCSGYGRIKHGQAVAIGLVLACQLAQSVVSLDTQVTAALTTLLQAFGLPVHCPAELAVADLITSMMRDKKNKHDAIRFILPHALGHTAIHEDVSHEQLRVVLEQSMAHNK